MIESEDEEKIHPGKRTGTPNHTREHAKGPAPPTPRRERCTRDGANARLSAPQEDIGGTRPPAPTCVDAEHIGQVEASWPQGTPQGKGASLERPTARMIQMRRLTVAKIPVSGVDVDSRAISHYFRVRKTGAKNRTVHQRRRGRNWVRSEQNKKKVQTLLTESKKDESKKKEYVKRRKKYKELLEETSK